MPIINVKKKVAMQQYLDGIESGTKIFATELSKRFNLSNASRAGKELGQRNDIDKVDKGVYVKV
jgi:hypothetical protein